MGRASAGGLIRDEKRSWFGGFSFNMGLCSVLEIELWAIFKGLELAWSFSLPIVIVEFDCELAIKVLDRREESSVLVRNLVRAC